MEHLEKLNSADDEDTPAISNDGLRLWFFRGGERQTGIWMAERASRGDPWRDPFFVEALNPGHADGTQAMNARVDLPELRAVVGLNGPETQGSHLTIACGASRHDGPGRPGRPGGGLPRYFGAPTRPGE
ncbi:hypothetical protein [Sorangium sp. So ce388]|uniref:hypothetical protein n=1 Tax=Sorangium sp. So ce388 TaxID=3133309 RepID=UPI003F5AFB6D